MDAKSGEGLRHEPGDEGALAAIVAAAAREHTPLAVEGGGTRRRLGRPMQTAATLSTVKLSGVTLYEPTELVLSARAGTPLAEIEALLAAKNQRLAFEPMDHRALYGSAGEPTIGGVAAANISGPRRVGAGAARDSLIGVRAVTGTGEVVKSGGRVMKNVTGLDLVKFLAGSYGTLAVLSEVSFKLQPMPETEATIVLSGLDDRRAVVALSAALGSPFSVTGAAHRPAFGSEPARTYIRLEGFAVSVADRAARLARELAGFAPIERIDAEGTRAIWRGIRDLESLGAAAGRPLWRVSVKPSDGPAVVDAARRAVAADVLYDWGGGLVWIAGGEGADAGAAVVRAAVKTVGGHATLVRAPEDIRHSVDIFEPPSDALLAVTRRLKATFDPAGVLNPGRIYPGL
jgi:glycolate oxidase FAD binding subunit